MSLWHLDWCEMKKIDPQLGEWLLTVQDDASRKIMAWGIYDNPTSDRSVRVLQQAVDRHGVPDEVITDKGSQFFAVDCQEREKGYTRFEEFLLGQRIGHILARTNHPQTNGKIERLFHTLATQARYHGSFDGLVDWYNTRRPHMSLGMATPEQAFWARMRSERVLGTTSHILYQGLELPSTQHNAK